MKQKCDRYEMHKYWGKKPSKHLGVLINTYSEEGDIVFDPFSGYGVFCCESYIMNRNVISNDLNPISYFIQNQLFQKEIDLNKLKSEFNTIINEFESYVDSWYSFVVDGEKVTAINVLRNQNNEVIKCKYKSANSSKLIEYSFSEKEMMEFHKKENTYVIYDWYPGCKLFENSRISAKKNMYVSNLFTRRTLACHARLFFLINKHSSGNEKKLLLLAFTANLANCSRLVPPIKSRGDMAPGAWMTGFYTGDKFLENNVLHYFNNRFSKVLKGKNDYLRMKNNFFYSNDVVDNGNLESLEYFEKSSCGYIILSEDVKNLSLNNNSVDYIFTDPPYGDTVPYFEQSIIWNSWLQLEVNYNDEIVVSNSPERGKNIVKYSEDIKKAICEIFRVLKPNKYFSLTFHSLSGYEWNSLTNACIMAGFELYDFFWLTQKTFTPRQINRAKSVKGDVLITFRKPSKVKIPKKLTLKETSDFFEKSIDEIVKRGNTDTNRIFMEMVRLVFEKHVLLDGVNFFNILKSNYRFDGENWCKYEC